MQQYAGSPAVESGGDGVDEADTARRRGKISQEEQRRVAEARGCM